MDSTRQIWTQLLHFEDRPFPNLIPNPSRIFPVKILQDPKFVGSCQDLRKILQISYTILMLRTVQEMTRFGHDPGRFLKISWH